MSISIKLKELSRLGLTSDIGRSLAVNIISKHYKHSTKEVVKDILNKVLAQPEVWKEDPAWGSLATHLAPEEKVCGYKTWTLRSAADLAPCRTYGGKYIDGNARQQMQTALQLPVAVQGALMPDAHGGYGLPIGGVLATSNAVIPYAVGVDIGCRMALSIFPENDKYLVRYAYQVKEAIRQHTHFGMEGQLEQRQEHPVLDNTAFQQTDLLRSLHGKAARQLGTSGSGNHFVEFGVIELYMDNQLQLPEGSYLALLSHSGSRGLGAAIATHYSHLAREQCRLPSQAQQLAWFDMDSEAGQEYWLSMTLAGDYAKACHDRIHANLSRALGLQALAVVENHHNFAWKETLEGRDVIVHRKGATPAHNGELGIIPGSMLHAGYLVSGNGEPQSLCSAAHGAGRAMSRKRAKDNFTVSAMKKLLAQHEVTLIGGSVEESPLAYKSIEEVMSAQQDLVTVQGRFLPKIVRMNKE